MYCPRPVAVLPVRVLADPHSVCPNFHAPFCFSFFASPSLLPVCSESSLTNPYAVSGRHGCGVTSSKKLITQPTGPTLESNGQRPTNSPTIQHPLMSASSRPKHHLSPPPPLPPPPSSSRILAFFSPVESCDPCRPPPLDIMARAQTSKRRDPASRISIRSPEWLDE